LVIEDQFACEKGRTCFCREQLVVLTPQFTQAAS
jgi:hypothetical protein